jgi:hypothetical protein
VTSVSDSHVAQAIGELGHEQTLAAREYLAAWRSLTSYGVPSHNVRHYLDRSGIAADAPGPDVRCEQTEALCHAEAWVKPRALGVLALVGARGIGKTLAGVWWADYRRRRGMTTRWLSAARWGRLSFDAIRLELDKAAGARALVIDDLGAGSSTSTEHAREKINGLLLERIEENRPTMLLANGSRADLLGWLDPRILDRLTNGGDCPALADAQSLRGPEQDTVGSESCPCGSRGACTHGERWRYCCELLDLVGCSRESRPANTDGTGPTVERWRVGTVLEITASRPANIRAAAMLGLGREDVRARARAIAEADNTEEMISELQAAISRLTASTDAKTIGEATEEIAAARRRTDNIARSKSVAAALLMPLAGKGEGTPWSNAEFPERPPAWARCKEGCSHRSCEGKRRLQRAGFDVETIKPSDGVARQLVAPRFRVTFDGKVMSKPMATRTTAWDFAGRLAAYEGCATVLHVGELAG